jgi:putative glutamine amidotransferase
MRVRIGLSYAPPQAPYPRYVEAVRDAAARLGADVEIVDLWSNRERARDIDAIIFTGGEDVAPERYGKGSERGRCGEIRPDRDEHEFGLVDIARERALPMLGICRGTQLLNVAYGGSLITDIDTAKDHTKTAPGVDGRHDVIVQETSLIGQLAGAARSNVNSSHHQAVDRLAEPFAITARSAEDEIVEAFEWARPHDKPFLLAVQWHPERMNQSEALAGPVFETFLKAVQSRNATVV